MKQIISVFRTLILCVGLFAALGVTAFALDASGTRECYTFTFDENTGTLNVSQPEPLLLPLNQTETETTNHFFQNETEIKSVILENFKQIAPNMFDGCTNLTSVTFKKGGTPIGIYSYAFRSTAITSIEIPATVISIKANAFAFCYRLTDVTFEKGRPSRLNTIGRRAFYESGVTSIEIPATVTSIGSEAFMFCDGLTDVTFARDSQLETIDEYAFRGTGITSFTVPGSVTSIGYGAFAGCSNLTTVTFLGSPASIDDYAFSRTAADVYIPEGWPYATSQFGGTLNYITDGLTASTLSEGNVWIICAVAAAAVIAVGAIVIAKKKKTSAAEE